MYIALTQPKVPEFRASLKLTPVEKPLMRVRTHYKKESVWSRTNCQILTVSWFLILAGYVISLI